MEMLDPQEFHHLQTALVEVFLQPLLHSFPESLLTLHPTYSDMASHTVVSNNTGAKEGFVISNHYFTLQHILLLT